MTTPPLPAFITLPALAISMGVDANKLRDFMAEITPEDQRPGRGHRWTFDFDTAEAIINLYRATQPR